MVSYSVQRILLQLITGAEASIETLVQSAKIFFHYRFIPWECVVVGDRIGIIVPYQPEASYDLIVGKADIKYIEDVYTLMWYPYLVLFIDEFDIQTVVTKSLVDYIDSLADFSRFDSISELYKKCVFVPRLFINRHPELTIDDFKITEILRLYTRKEGCLKITNFASNYYNLFVLQDYLVGPQFGHIKELYQGTLLHKQFEFLHYQTSLNHRHAKVPPFTELPEVTWTHDNANGLPTVQFRPSPRYLRDALNEEYENMPKIKSMDIILDIYLYLVNSAEFLGLSPFSLAEFIASLDGDNPLVEQVFLSLLYMVRSSIEKDKFPISNSQKYVDTDKATAMIIKNGDIDERFLARANAILNAKLGEKKMFKYTRYYKPVLWVFCFAVFLREFVDVEQVTNVVDILEILLRATLPETHSETNGALMQVDGAVDPDDDMDYDSNDPNFKGPNRAITRSMETPEGGNKRKSTNSSTSSELPTKKQRIERIIDPVTAPLSKESSTVSINQYVVYDENSEIAATMIHDFYKLPSEYKIQLISYMISVVLLSREYSIFVDKSLELQQNAEMYLLRNEHLLKSKRDIANNLKVQIKLVSSEVGATAVSDLEAVTKEIDAMSVEFNKNQKMIKTKDNSRVVPLGRDRFQNEYYFLDNKGPMVALAYGVGVLLIKGSGIGNEIFGKSAQDIPSSDIKHYCYMPEFPEAYQLDVPKGMDRGKTPKEWMCYTLVEEVELLMEWLFDGISQELALKNALKTALPDIKEAMEKRNFVIF